MVSDRVGRLGRLTLALAALLVVPGSLGLHAQDGVSETAEIFNIGVQATEGATRVLEAWQPTVARLNAAAEAQQMPYRFAVRPHTQSTMFQAVENGELDLVLSDPAAYVALEVENGARAVLSMAHMVGETTFDRTGAVIFVRRDSPIRSMNQLPGTRLMAAHQSDFSGWWLAEQEMRKHRLDPPDTFSEVVFSGGNEREVVYAVQSGLVDVGVIRAGVLESLARDGVIELGSFAPVQKMTFEGYPFWVSTPLYPEWVLSAMPGVPEGALAHVIDTLLRSNPGGPEARALNNAAWQAPENYQSVHDLLISLRVRPYENYLVQAATRIYRSYKLPILGVLALTLMSLAFLSYELRRNVRLAEERKDVLQSEVRSKQFYRNAIEEHTVFCMLTRDGVISHVNAQFLDVTDRSRQSLINQPLDILLTQKDQETLAQDVMASMEAGAPWSGPLKLSREDGSVAWVQCSFIPVTSMSNNLSEVAIVATDVTSTRKGVSEERFQDTLELITDQVIVMRPHTLELIHCNRAAQRLFAHRLKDGNWKGRKATEFIKDSDRETLLMRAESIIEGPQRRVTWEVEAQDGKTYEISLEYAEPDQDEPRLIAMYRDITERKVAEKAKNEFIATVSHELRTPLTSMKGALGLALSGAVGEMPEKMEKLVSMAGSNCDRLVLLINDILDLEKIEAGKMDFKMEAFDLRELIDASLEANQFYADKYGVTLRAEIDGEDDDGFRTYGDQSRLRQVMDNLLSNAAKFSEQGSEIIVGLKQQNDRLRVTIRDFGSGIPQAAQAGIFDKFTQADSSDTRSKGGTGLGLSIAKMIVESHKGRIFFVSEENVGTKFFVDLPRMEGENLVAVPRDAEEDRPGVEVLHEGGNEEADTKNAAAEAVAVLIEMARRSGMKSEIEQGRVNVQQVVSGRGILGQSKVMNWLSGQSRSLLGGLFERGKLNRRDVLILELDATGTDLPPYATSAFDLAQDWLNAVAKTAGHDDVVGMMVTKDSNETEKAEAGDFTVLNDGIQAITLSEQDDFDVIATAEIVNGAQVVTLFQVSEGKLPEDLPLTIIVVQQAQEQAARGGVVSKFSGMDEGGRGRARRRSA